MNSDALFCLVRHDHRDRHEGTGVIRLDLLGISTCFDFQLPVEPGVDIGLECAVIEVHVLWRHIEVELGQKHAHLDQIFFGNLVILDPECCVDRRWNQCFAVCVASRQEGDQHQEQCALRQGEHHHSPSAHTESDGHLAAQFVYSHQPMNSRMLEGGVAFIPRLTGRCQYSRCMP